MNKTRKNVRNIIDATKINWVCFSESLNMIFFKVYVIFCISAVMALIKNDEVSY
jgi:hypothetical protein